MASPTVPWGIPQFDDNDPFAPVQAPLNAQSAALNVALNDGAFRPYATKALMDAAPGTRVGQHASVYADGTATNNGDYRWNGNSWGSRLSRSVGVSFNTSTLSSGIITVTHGLGVVPTWAQVTLGNNGNDTLSRILSPMIQEFPITSPSTLAIRFRRTDTSEWAGLQPVSGFLLVGI